ncbi:MAG: SulP family inorganic anion transporter [Deltaproteobacteria bacterium]|nr:SulP family inorganic anion transporter [Deltaproteobacteria bacterium]
MTTAALGPRFLRYFPAVAALKTYGWTELRADTLAGVTVAAVAVPQAMAYAMVAGIPPQYGLYTAIVMTAVGAFFDSSRQLINGPTNAISIATLSALAGISSVAGRIEAAVLLAFLVGAIQLGITLLRLGDLTRFISHSVIVGFTLGASALLVLDQLKNLLGLTPQGGPHDHFLWSFWLTVTQGGGLHGPTALVGLVTIVAILVIRWFKARLGLTLLPEFLLVLGGAAGISAWLGLEGNGVRIVGSIPAHFPRPAIPTFHPLLVADLATSALAIATLGLLEAIAMAKAIAAQTRQKLDLNQQCLSEGLANFVGSFFQCMPGSGSLTRSSINQQAGARTQWSGVIAAGGVLATMMLLAPYARFVPRAALAGILIVTCWRMVDRAALAWHLRATKFDAAIVVVTAVSALAISVEFCVLIGVFLSFLLTVPRAGRMRIVELVLRPNGLVDQRGPADHPCGGVLVFALEGEMFFGSTAALESHLEAVEARTLVGTRVVVLQMRQVRSPDAVGAHQLAWFLERMRSRNIQVVLSGVPDELHAILDNTGISDDIPETSLFRDLPDRSGGVPHAVREAYRLAQGHCPECRRFAGSTAAGGQYA